MKRSILVDLAIPSTLKVKFAYKVKTIKCTLKIYPKPIQYGTLKQVKKIQLSAKYFLFEGNLLHSQKVGFLVLTLILKRKQTLT